MAAGTIDIRLSNPSRVSWESALGNLIAWAAAQQSQDLDVIGVREEIGQPNLFQTVFRKPPEIAGQSLQAAGHVQDSGGTQFADARAAGDAETRAGRIDDEEIGGSLQHRAVEG